MRRLFFVPKGRWPLSALCLLPTWLAALPVGAERVDVGMFSKGRLMDWQPKAFKGVTDYRLVRMEGVTVLRASSESSASGLYRELTIDLTRTPYLNWSWRVAGTLGALHEQSKVGDDYPARLYVAVRGGLAFWRSRALNYVWSSSTAVGTHWPNAFAGAAVMMLAVRSGERDVGRWVPERRNVREDWRRLFGEDIRQLDAVALMSDSDNAGGRALAFYGDIYFSSDWPLPVDPSGPDGYPRQK